MSMKWRRIALTAAALAALAPCRLPADEIPSPAEQAEMMARSMELAKPGEEHRLLEKLAGTWNFEIKMWMEPGAEPKLIQGMSTGRMILGGRFLVSESKTPSPMGEVEQMSIMGFDRRFGHYTTIGLDTWGTYYVTAAGPYDSTTRTITMSGQDHDPVFKGTQIYDFVLRLVSDDEFVWEIIFKDEVHTRGGDPFKMVAITYRRTG